MEKTFRYNLVKVLQEVNGEPELVPYWIKLDLLDRGVPIEVDPLNVRDDQFKVVYGKLGYFTNEGMLVLRWTVDKN